jgi:hypothetical protein
MVAEAAEDEEVKSRELPLVLVRVAAPALEEPLKDR